MEALVALGDLAEALRTAERYGQRVREDRLAIQVARAVEPRVDRVWFVDLSALRESAGVIAAVALACGVQPEPGRDPVDAIASSLAGRRVLIVLDNFEQVVDAAGEVARLVNAAPEAKLLVTSRMRLAIRAEHEFFVAPLALPEHPTNIGAVRVNSAVRLFLRRAAAANPSLVSDVDTLVSAARICARVDGLPLAIIGVELQRLGITAKFCRAGRYSWWLTGFSCTFGANL
jgi:predicted ATPase